MQLLQNVVSSLQFLILFGRYFQSASPTGLIPAAPLQCSLWIGNLYKFFQYVQHHKLKLPNALAGRGLQSR